jgi:predicted nucleic acid-binding protein
MTFADRQRGEAIFLDANTLIYHEQFELLTGDALIVATMGQQGLTKLASEDADFDRVPWLTRYEPS